MKTISIKTICIFVLLFPVYLFAQDDFFPERNFLILAEREELINRTLDRYDQREFIPQETREVAIEKTLHDISVELSLEYVYASKGEQSFELLNDQGGRVSKLTYPTKGPMLILKGELGFFSKFFIGGRFASSDFKKTTNSDEDWGYWGWHNGEWKYIEYQITKQGCESKVEFFDVNLYYRFLDLNEEEVKKLRLSAKEDTIFDFLLIDSLSLDIFVGYQRYRGRYAMVDPVLEFLRIVDGTRWQAEGLPVDVGLNSPYKIYYDGPRLGLRAKGSKGKITSQLSLAFCVGLKTKAYGYWNSRDLSFWQKGTNGYGLDFGCEITYPFTSFFSAGLGYNFLYFKQKKLKMYAEQKGVPWWEGFQDRIRNAISEIQCPSVIFKYIW